MFMPRRIIRFLKNTIVHKMSLPEAQKREHYDPSAYPQGINIIGHLSADMGLGQGARLVARSLIDSSVPISLVNFKVGNTATQKDDEFKSITSNKLVYSINIIHINPGQLDLLTLMMKNETWDKRYNIGFWLWELEDFPDEWVKYFDLVDEIWTPSSFVTNAIKRKTTKTVKTIPYGLTMTKPKSQFQPNAFYGINNDAFVFLTMFDSNSTIERKNPLGAIHAFKKAFLADDKHVQLVVKINNAKKTHLKAIKHAIGDYQNITILNKNLKRVEVDELINISDVFVSLHRSEGFGLVIAEAMHLGKPVIATNYSSNTDFMTDNVSCLVDYSLIELDHNYYMFKKGQKWADPNLDQASTYMTKLYSNKTYYETISNAAETYIKSKLSLENAQHAIINRLKEANLLN
jgi:glycosyltransferase involved in cell wall biosynthesis